ncbi:MAG: undecaprenyl-phosphate glucose phosphotransferase [Rhodobacteraceae bacterium]|nr:undecaprenyl-phosphate glucose phosphotransferase [Paracoccaceae bacterium]
MVDVSARKRLFSQVKRRSPYAVAPQRLLGGQALSLAQRLSEPTIRPSVFSVSLFVLDILVVALTGWISFGLVEIWAPGGVPFAWVIWLGGLIMATVARLVGGYRFRRMRRAVASAALGVLALGIAFGALWGILTLAGLGAGSIRAWIGLWAAWAAGPVVLIRLAIWARIRTLMRLGRLEHRFVLVGGGETLAQMIREINKERGQGRRLCGFFDSRDDVRSPAMIEGFHKMGDVADLVEFTRLAHVDTVVVAIPKASAPRIQQLLSRLFVLPVDIRVMEGAEVPAFSRKRRSRIGPFTLVEIYKRPLGGLRAVEKRLFDIVFASLAIVALAPLMLVIAVLIRLESPGPVLFRQKRHGFNNKPIQVLKFRSMYSDQCDPTAVRAVRRGDNRVTRIGRFIRRASIDELPQFFNVLQGTLSLVGPRPHATAARTGDIVYDQVTEAYSARHKVKPGITGWAQINGWRGEMNSSEKIRARVEHDLYYIENWSLWLDFKIMILTPWSLVTTKNAY